MGVSHFMRWYHCVMLHRETAGYVRAWELTLKSSVLLRIAIDVMIGLSMDAELRRCLPLPLFGRLLPA